MTTQAIRQSNQNDKHSPDCLPFVHYDCVFGSHLRLRGCRDEAGLNEKLLIQPSIGRNLEFDKLASFIDIRVCCAAPRR